MSINDNRLEPTPDDEVRNDRDEVAREDSFDAGGREEGSERRFVRLLIGDDQAGVFTASQDVPEVMWDVGTHRRKASAR